MDTGLIIEAVVICQSQKILVLLEKNEVFKLHCLLSKYLTRKKVNQSRI